MNIAITGASGYIGGHLLRQVIARGDTARALAYTRTPTSDTGASATWIQGSVESPDVMQSLIQNVEVVAHLASFVHRPAITVADVDLCRRINVGGMKTLLDAAQRQLQPPFILFVSSIAVYAPSDNVRDETSPTRPTTPYGITKLEAEHLLLEAVAAGRVRGCVLRPSMVYGPAAPGNMLRFFRLIDGSIVPLPGAGANQKSILYIDNLIAAALACLDAQAAVNGQVFNVSNVPPLPMRAILDHIAQGIGHKTLIFNVPIGIVESMLRLHDASLGTLRRRAYLPTLRTFTETSAITGEKLTALTAYREVVSNQEGIRRMADWYRSLKG